MFRDEYMGMGFRGWPGHRARRGDMGPIILKVISEKPMHGYEIISDLEKKSYGLWRPSAGSVYPNLQLLEEQELVTSTKVDGKKIYTITDKGKQQAKDAEEHIKSHFEKRQAYADSFRDLKISFAEIMAMIKKIASEESNEKNQKIKEIIFEAKDKISKLIDENEVK